MQGARETEKQGVSYLEQQHQQSVTCGTASLPQMHDFDYASIHGL